MLVRGFPQRRQSEGKSVEKRLSATALTDETKIDRNELPHVTTLVPVDRIGSPLLLKTNLPTLPAVAPAAASEFTHSIAATQIGGNASLSRRAACLFYLLPGSDRHKKPVGRFVGSSHHSAPGGTMSKAAGISQGNSVDVNDNQLNRRSLGSETIARTWVLLLGGTRPAKRQQLAEWASSKEFGALFKNLMN